MRPTRIVRLALLGLMGLAAASCGRQVSSQGFAGPPGGSGPPGDPVDARGHQTAGNGGSGATASSGTSTPAGPPVPVQPGAPLPMVACKRVASVKRSAIPAAPHELDRPQGAWTGQRLVLYGNNGLLVYDPRRRRWQDGSTKIKKKGRTVRALAGPWLLVQEGKDYPAPMKGVLVDTTTLKERRFESPRTVLFEPFVMGQQMLFSGSSAGPLISDDLLLFDPASGRWQEIAGSAPDWLRPHGDSVDVAGPGFWFHWGGTFEQSLHANGSLLAGRTRKRHRIATTGAPSPRTQMVSATGGSSIAIFGGQVDGPSGRHSVDDGAIFDVKTARWQPIPSIGRGAWDGFEGAMLTDRHLMVWGNHGGTPAVASFSRRDGTWALAGLREAPYRHGMIAADDLAVFFGTRSGMTIIDPAQMRGCESDSPPQAHRSGAVRVWTGSSILLWGGAQIVDRGGCENFKGPGGCDPVTERVEQVDGLALALRRR